MKDFKAGIYINQGYYRSFQPAELNKKWLLDDMEIQQLLSQATDRWGVWICIPNISPISNP